MSNVASLFLEVLSIRSEVEPLDPSIVPSVATVKTTGQYFQVAVVAVLVYDALITVDKEAKFFWKLPRNTVDYVYFVNRYVGIFGAITFLFWNVYGVDLMMCEWSSLDVEMSWVTIISIDYILMIRVLALYSQDRRLSLCLGLLLMLGALFKLAMVIYLDIFQRIAVGSLAKNVTICGQDLLLPWQLGVIDWVIPMAYGAVLMVLALYKAAEYWKISAGFKGFMLVKVLIRDQISYFMLVITCCMFDIIQFKLEISNAFLAGILNALGNPAFFTILGSRMLFNLKEAGERGQNEGTSYGMPSQTISEIDFAEPVNAQRDSEPDIEGHNEEA
ncbi:hypothetical protein ACEPAF_10009 [Sanghuangporus sanghuang]